MGDAPTPAATPAQRPSGLRPPTNITGRIARPSGLPKPPTPMTPYPPTPVTTSAPTPRASGAVQHRPHEQARIRKINEEVSRMKLADVEEEDLEGMSSYDPRRRDSEISRRSSFGVGSRKRSKDYHAKRSSDALPSAEALWENARRLSEAGVRRCSDASVVLTEDTDSFIIGDKVWVGGTKPGQIAYIGETQFAPGEWAGVVLDEPIGKNDGSVAGIRYFQCEAKRGVFSRLTRLTRLPLITGEGGDAGEPTSPLSRRPSSVMSGGSMRDASMNSLSPNSPTHTDLRVGERVIVMSSQGSKAGVLRYMGTTEFAAGTWAGVELDDPLGKNDGSVGNKRYFECMPKYGLFAPVAKVSRSPSATPGLRRGICSVHHAAATTASNLKRRGSRESVASTAGSTSSALKSPAPRVRLGVNSLGQKPASRTTPNAVTAHATLQSTLRDKEQYIEQLLKERELERAEVTRAASQVDDVEQKLSNLKLEYEQYQEQMEAQMQDMQLLVARVESDKNELSALLDEERRRMEDLQFRYEEASIAKTDIERRRQDREGQDEVHLERIKELEKALEDERKRAEELEMESNRAFEEEEALEKVREEAEQELKSKMEELMSELGAKGALLTDREESLKSKEQEVSNLRVEVEDLKKNIVAQEEKESSLNSDLQRLKDENSKLFERITAAEESVKQVLKEKEKLEENIAELQAFKVEKIKNESDTSTREAARIQELEGQLTLMNEEQKKLIDKYSSLLSESKKDIDELKQAKDEEINVLKQTLQKQADETLKLTQAELEKMTQMLSSFKLESSKEIEQLRSQKDAEIEGLKESLMKHGDEALKAKQVELDKMTQMFSSLKMESSKEIELLKSQKDAEIEEIKKSLKRHEDEALQAVQAEVERVTQSLSALKLESSKEIEQLRIQKDEEIESLKQSIMKHGDDALKAKQQELDKVTEMLSSLQIERKNELEEMKKIHFAEMDALKQSSQSREDEIVLLKSQMETLQSTLEGQKTENTETISIIESKMTEANTQRDNLLKENEKLLPQLAKLESEVVSLKEEKKKSDEVLLENEKWLEAITSQLGNLLSIMGGKLPNGMPPASQGDANKSSDQARPNETSIRLKSVGSMLQSCAELGMKLQGMMEELEETRKREAEKSSSFQKEKESLESMAQSLKSLLEKQEKDILDRQSEINLLKAEKSQANKYKSLMENLEREKNQLERKVVELQVAVAQSKANANSEDSTYQHLMEEKEMAQGQIDFLNSVIVDMQRKNDDLKARVEILEIGITPADADELNLNGIKPRMVAPRLFCDICDVFDLHDTEDCPRQASESSPPPLLRHRSSTPEGGKSKRIIPERPYCDTCEIFGHATADCEDGETF